MFSIIIILFLLLILSVITYSLLRKKQVIDEPPNRLAVCLFIFLLFFSLCFAIAVQCILLYIVVSGVNFLFEDYITYESFFSLISFSLFASVIAVFWSPFLLFIGKGLAYLLKLPVWLTYALEWVSSWIVLYLSINYILHINLVNVSIGDYGILILSFFVSFIFIEIDLVYSRMKQRKQSLNT
ncbi:MULTISPECIES: hypothetical protein [Bacillus]|uniref:hypothetical protein n=1 Tax=Bacillus TaxID=1386 RepID=UPI00119D9037|nr:hypothetical protein [Bacillus safensis]UXO87127.1 hypothetical protein N7921_14345 [Bacillus safensis]WCL58614.1 hypothetical protein PNF30_05630 [Bacillus safensis]